MSVKVPLENQIMDEEHVSNLKEEDDDDEDEEPEDDDDEEPEDDEEKQKVRLKAYERYLPELLDALGAMHGELRPNLATDKAEKSCAVCPTMQWFKGWRALLAHAETYKKKKIQQHRGYGNAIKAALEAHGTTSSHSQFPSRARTAAVGNESKHLIVWPPLVVIKIAGRRQGLVEMIWHVLGEEFPGRKLPSVVAIGSTTALLVFPSEAVGYLEAKMVSECLANRWSRPIIKSYLATPEDMRRIDPERSLVSWAEESFYLKVQQAQRKEKEEHDYEKARLKEMELSVENLGDNELKLKERKRQYEWLIENKQKEVEILNRRADELEKLHADNMRRLETEFQQEMIKSEASSTRRLRMLNNQRQEKERRMEEEIGNRKNEIESLQLQFQAVRKDIKQKEAQKAMERELELMRQKESFVAGLAKAEALFNKDARRQESLLQEQQHHEQMQLMEQAKKEREHLLQVLLTKLEKEKVKEEPGKKEERECYLCMEPLTVENRAMFNPCGHARICLQCAIEVYEQDGLCPECRMEIKKKPVLLGRVYT